MVLVVQVSPCTHIVYACSGWSSLLVAKRAINKIKNYWILNYLFKLLSKPFDFIFELCNGGGYVWIDNEQRLRNLQYNKKCISKKKQQRCTPCKALGVYRMMLRIYDEIS